MVDKCIDTFLKIVVPGRGAGESNWIMRNWRTLEQSAERQSREYDIRSSLRDWDANFPEIHHELIVRWVTGFVVSILAQAAYQTVKDVFFGKGGGRDHPGGRRVGRR